MTLARKIASSISGRVKISLIAVFFVTVSYLFVDRRGHRCVLQLCWLWPLAFLLVCVRSTVVVMTGATLCHCKAW